jgi:signal transduction histidine kinase
LLLNLLLNGVEAAGPGGWVRIEWFGTAANWHVCVVDSGPGPPEHLVERLFEAFVTSKPEGVGLGLAVARQIAEAHGGTLAYRRDEHTCFELILPRCDAAEVPAEPTPIAAAAAANSFASY